MATNFTHMQSQIESMSDEEFERHKESLAAQKLEKPKRLATQFNQFLNEISLQQYHFDRCEKEVVILKDVKRDELLNYYKSFILPNSSGRHALSIHIVSTVDGTPTDDSRTYEVAENLVRITDLAIFKSSKELYPMVQPYINIQPKGGKSKL